MKPLLAALASSVLLLPVTARAADKDSIEVVGFSDDGTVFAYWTFGVSDGSGYPHAELNVFSTLTGSRNEKESQHLTVESEDGTERSALDKLKAREAKRLQALKLGRDRGIEMYKSGTPTRTSFTVAGAAVELTLEVRKGRYDPDQGEAPKDRISLHLEVGGKRQTLLVGGGGFDYSLNSVRLSADMKSIAVLLKHSQQGFEGPDRRYDCAAGRLPAK